MRTPGHYFGQACRSLRAPALRMGFGTALFLLAWLVHTQGVRKGYADLARLYFILHSDHESGNVSAHATHLVGSSLSDVYFAFSAGLSGLAGPLQGLANQECLGWLLDVHNKLGGVPSRYDLYKFAWDTLNGGHVIPGYGHAVLRVPDPRFTAQMEFAKARFPDDELVRLADMVFDVVPAVLKEQGKAKNPAPNVDAISGTLQYHYGVREFDTFLSFSGNVMSIPTALTPMACSRFNNNAILYRGHGHCPCSFRLFSSISMITGTEEMSASGPGADSASKAL